MNIFKDQRHAKEDDVLFEERKKDQQTFKRGPFHGFAFFDYEEYKLPLLDIINHFFEV